MNTKSALFGGALGAILLSPGIASASSILDTGAPTSDTGSPVSVLNANQWLADEFTATSTEDITSLSAYLTQGLGQPGDTFTFDVYSNSGFTNRVSTRPAPVFSATGTFTANGWNTTSVNWVPSSSGTYWLALQVASPSNTTGLDAPGAGLSTTSGTASALAFAYAPSSHQYAISSAAPVGLQISATPVPVPAAIWLLGSGVLGLGSMARRRAKRAV